MVNKFKRCGTRLIDLRYILEEAQSVNRKLGHENLGFLSEEYFPASITTTAIIAAKLPNMG